MITIHTVVGFSDNCGKPGDLVREQNTIIYDYDDGVHYLSIYGPYGHYSDPEVDSDVCVNSEDPVDVIRWLIRYPDNAEIAALVKQLMDQLPDIRG